jgi:hypothetical protein
MRKLFSVTKFRPQKFYYYDIKHYEYYSYCTQVECGAMARVGGEFPSREVAAEAAMTQA